jgi:1-acyl-sn-glycerol-3-phosphate acyltransferase
VAAWLLAVVLGRPTLPWLAGFRIAGRRRIPREGGVVVVVNHVGDLDPIFVGVACRPRRALYLADARHYRRLPFARLLFAMGALPVEPGSPDTRTLRYARERLLAGDLIVIFAEGRPGWGAPMGEFLEGAAHLGLTPGVTVVPAAIWGVHRFMRGWRPVGRGPVLLAFGHPVPAPEDGSRRERAAALSRRTRAAVLELLEPMMRAYP